MVRSPARWALSALFAALALMVFASPAAARTEVRILGATEFQAAADQFLVPEPPGDVRILLVSCPGAPDASGCHTSGWRVDTIRLNPEMGGTEPETFAHEMGHAFESYMWNRHFRDGARFVPRIFLRIAPLLGVEPKYGMLTTTLWSERFAEAYGLCARVPTLEAVVATGYWGFTIDPVSYPTVCNLIRRLGTRYENFVPQPRVERRRFSHSLTVNRRISL